MKSWIFQGNPNQYDIRDRNNVDEGKEQYWQVRRYAKEIHAGDIVYLWRAGEQSLRGIYAWGRIAAEPECDADSGLRVKVKYEKRLPHHLSSVELRKLPSLEKHLLFRNAIGTNFSLNDAQAITIMEEIVTEFGPDYAPDASGLHAP